MNPPRALIRTPFALCFTARWPPSVSSEHMVDADARDRLAAARRRLIAELRGACAGTRSALQAHAGVDLRALRQIIGQEQVVLVDRKSLKQGVIRGQAENEKAQIADQFRVHAGLIVVERGRALRVLELD